MTRNSFLPEIVKITGCDPEDAHIIATIMREMTNKPLGAMHPPQFVAKTREINGILKEKFGYSFSSN